MSLAERKERRLVWIDQELGDINRELVEGTANVSHSRRSELYRKKQMFEAMREFELIEVSQGRVSVAAHQEAITSLTRHAVDRFQEALGDSIPSREALEGVTRILFDTALQRAVAAEAAHASLLEGMSMRGTRQRYAVDWFSDEYITVLPADSARDNWYEATCVCGAETSGTQDVAEEWAFNHALEHLESAVKLIETPTEDAEAVQLKREQAAMSFLNPVVARDRAARRVVELMMPLLDDRTTLGDAMTAAHEVVSEVQLGGES